MTHVVAERWFGCMYTDYAVVSQFGTRRIAWTTAVWSARYGHVHDRRVTGRTMHVG